MWGLFVSKYFHPAELGQGKLALRSIEFGSHGRRGRAATKELLRTCLGEA